MSTSTPPSASALTCSRTAATRSAGGDLGTLVGGDRWGDRSGDEDAPSRLGLRLAGDPDPCQVDVAHRPGRALLGQAQPARAERVGLDDVHARAEIALVDRAD